MSKWLSRLPAAAGLLVLTGSAAMAQSQLVVEVPFTFHTVGATMAPGKYVIDKVASNAVPYYKVRHESGKTVLVVAMTSADYKSAEAKPEVAFLCAGEYCALKSIHPGYGNAGIEVQTPMKYGFRGEKSAVVRIPAIR